MESIKQENKRIGIMALRSMLRNKWDKIKIGGISLTRQEAKEWIHDSSNYNIIYY